MAKLIALTKNGSRVMPPSIWVFNFYRKAINLVQSASSEKVKVGTLKAAVIVLVMAFLIPTIFFTLSPTSAAPTGTSGTLIYCCYCTG